MKINLAATFLCLLLFAGCGTVNKSKKGQPPQQVEGEVYGDLRPADVIPGQRRESSKPKKRGVATSNPERPVMVFTDRECAHVRLPGIHIIPEGGVDLDLDALAHEFYYPYRGKLISDYGMRGRSMHTGVDIKAAPNDTIRAAFAGVVRMSKEYSGYGNTVVIRHYNGIETLYSHASRNLVGVNDVVQAGDPIALAGRTGRATTEHLHFEVRVGGEPIDPKKLIDPHAMEMRAGRLTIRQLGGKILAYNDPQEGEELMAAQGKPAQEYRAAAANDPAQVVDRAVYHTIKSGETLSAVARKYSTTVAKICRLSNISNPDKLRLNQRVRVK